MLTLEQVRELLTKDEADRIERTISTGNTVKFSEAVCAFANDLPRHRQPGYLLIGVNDNGSLSGLQVTDSLLLSLGELRANGNILPVPSLSVEKYTFPGGDVAVVEVQPSDLPPVRYKGQIWIRVGPRKAIATEQDERILTEKRIAQARSFDARPCAESVLSDLALGLFEGYRQMAIASDAIAANHRTIEQQLSSLRFFNPDRNCPTYAGILLFGQNPRFYLPGAYIQYLKLPGTSLTERPDDQAEISGDLFSVLREMETRARVLIHTTIQPVSALREKLHPNYPEIALRELLMNAVMHRNYESNTPIRFYHFSDHVEILSPGGLYGEATPENFPTRNSYRNPIIAEAMKELGFVNRYGYGVQRAQDLLRQNGNPKAEFEFDEHTVMAKIFPRQE